MEEVSQIPIELPTDSAIVIEQLLVEGVAVLKEVVLASDLGWLVELARAMPYAQQPEKYGERKVRQQVWSVGLSPIDPLNHFADRLQKGIVELFGSLFDTPLDFTARNIQYYPDGTLGIEPHRDQSVNRNLIALLTLSGQGRFRVYTELGGLVRFEQTIDPGSLLLMIAPGFHGFTERPVHSVDAIVGERYVLGFRQNVS